MRGLTRFLSGAIVLTALFTASYMRAQTSPVPPLGDPGLNALIDEALARNPDVLAAQEAGSAARSRPAQGRSLPNPMLSTAYTNDGWTPTLGSREMTTLALMGSQDLPYPGKRKLRADILSREAEQVEQQLARVKLAVAAAVKRAYYGLLLARGLLELIGEQETVWKEIEEVARARYAVGQGAQQDVLRVQIEVTRIEQLRTEQGAEVEIRLAELNRLLNRPATTPLETGAGLALQPVEASLDRVLDHLREISPELKSATLGTERATLGVALARKEFKPDFTLQAGYMNRGRLDPMWLAGVGISLPAYRTRLRSGLAEAEAQLRASQRLVESVQLQLRFRTQERLAQLKATEKSAALYGGGVIPQDRMSVEAALANYRTGQIPFITVLEALTTLYNDRVTNLGLVASHEKTRASLEEASLEETSSMAGGGAAGMPAVAGSNLGMAGAGGTPAGGFGSMGNR